MKVVTDSASWTSAATTVDDGTLTSFSVLGNQVTLTTVTDLLLTTRAGNVVDVRWNDDPAAQLGYASQAPLQRVVYSYPRMTINVVLGLASFCLDWPWGYAEAPITNADVTRAYKIDRLSPNPMDGFRDISQAYSVPKVQHVMDCWNQACPAGYRLVNARLSTSDGWSTEDGPIEIAC